jgi:hypothetical protein
VLHVTKGECREKGAKPNEEQKRIGVDGTHSLQADVALCRYCCADFISPDSSQRPGGVLFCCSNEDAITTE